MTDIENVRIARGEYVVPKPRGWSLALNLALTAILLACALGYVWQNYEVKVSLKSDKPKPSAQAGATFQKQANK